MANKFPPSRITARSPGEQRGFSAAGLTGNGIGLPGQKAETHLLHGSNPSLP
ncbi:MAG: hypothetical protein JEZ12_26495 [Desulfobacterium sp.]|nr:hypothetical protein [Desulfobacterium sp.]